MSGTHALTTLNQFPDAAWQAGAAAEQPTDLQEQLDRARDLFVGQFQEVERCHDMLDQIDPDDGTREPGEPLDDRLARILDLVPAVAPTVSEEDGR